MNLKVADLSYTNKEINMSEEENNFKHKQQDLTELNSDGNRDRGRNGEDLSPEELEEQKFKKRLEELRKRDPFIYR